MAYSGPGDRNLIPNRTIFVHTARDHNIEMGQLWEQLVSIQSRTIRCSGSENHDGSQSCRLPSGANPLRR
ncbi:hypothetical protein SAMN04487912_110216 [Arthrobacter sp. cf158]|nr:hypothetical protein SAMN04487912_110216 [Arthrobacter sp. cf158]